MHRFFLPAECIQQGTVSFPAPCAHQLRNVLRLRPGDRVEVADNSGWVFVVEITALSSDAAEGAVKKKALGETEPRTKITVYQGLLKADKYEYVLQKCTELGAAAFVPVVCDRSIVANVQSLSNSRLMGKVTRWRDVVREAAEQSRRAKLPQVREPVLFRHACEAAKGMALLLSENERQRNLREVLHAAFSPPGAPQGDPSADYETGERLPLRKLPQREGPAQRPFSVSLFIGPEGGLSPEELVTGQRMGLIPVGLGPRILRAETAAIVGTSIVLYEWGDLG
ncbi:MAG: 16S rRNA (uracil(1498)-N(3))-methyltransferase [Chloroflexota bacterium]|nr:MAG: 16S rRNA (uracil(1498)-N(3))-methyltransferase [Chloroflexota bacterium]